MVQALKTWGPAALWAAVLFLFSEIPGLSGGPRIPVDDKVVHFVLYGVLGAALGWGRWMSERPTPHAATLAVGWAYGAVDEWHQSFVPGRSPDPADFLVDVAGVTAGYVVFLFLARRIAGPGRGGEPDEAAERNRS